MRFALAVLFTLFALPAMSQEVWTFSPNAAQTALAANDVAKINTATCLRFTGAGSCNQAQACAGANAAGGSGCTVAQARAAQARIFPATTTGREEFVTVAVFGPYIASAKARKVAGDNEARCIAWNAFNQTQKDAACVANGLAAGCDLCP